jgi:glutamyl-tRNA reductase
VHLGSARRLVNAELERYAAASSARQVAPLIGDLHGWADAIRAAEIERYAARLARMADDDRATVEALSRSIVAKLLHQPTITLKGAAGTAKGARLAEAARELFDRS